MVATGRGATQGVLFCDAAAIENLCKIDTLTEGRPAFERAVGVNGFSEDDVLRLAASLDPGSEHPLTAAIVNAARDRKLTLEGAEQFDSASGIGVRGVVGGLSLAIGNATLMQQLGIDVAPLASQAEALRSQGASVMHLAAFEHDIGKLAGLLAVSDPIKATTADALAMLRKSGLRIIMASGDGLITAQAVGKRLGIDEVHGEGHPPAMARGQSAAEKKGGLKRTAVWGRWRPVAVTLQAGPWPNRDWLLPLRQQRRSRIARMAETVAVVCLGGNHLRQDLQLPSRKELSAR